MAEFFAMEASEYLDRLDAMVSASSAPDADEFQRLARALRGAALMANQQPIAVASGAFEGLARAVKSGSRPWDEATKQLAIRAVDDLKVFIRKVREWTDADTARAQDLATALQGMSGRPSQPMPAPSVGPDSGTRAFIGREGALLASALDRVAQAITQHPVSAESLQGVLNVMQPLRGLATLSDLPPMPELLEGIETAVGEATRTKTPRTGAAEVFAAGARALSVVTRQVAGEGTADPESAEVRQFAKDLRGFLDLDQPIRPIESLYFDDAGPHVVEAGTPAVRPPLGEVEFVSHGEHLRHIADRLDQGSSPTIREFRSHGLAGTFRALESAAGTPFGDAAAGFARAARAAVAGGRAVDDTANLAAVLREAGAILSTAAQGPPEAIAARLAEVASSLGGPAPTPQSIGASAPPAAAPTPAPPASPEVAAVPAPAPVAAVPTAAPGPMAVPSGEGALAASLQEQHRLVEERGLGPASLDELLAGIGSAPAAPAAPAAPPPEAPLISIDELVYDPADALARAASLREEVRTAVAQGASNTNDLIEEIFDLVQIGLGNSQ